MIERDVRIQNTDKRKFWGISIPPDKRYEITPDVLPEIEGLSRALAKWDAIRFQGIDKPIVVDYQPIKVHPNPEIFAQTILQMAYLEGGNSEMEKVYEATLNKGINVRHMDLPFTLSIEAVATPELWPSPFRFGTIVRTQVLKRYYQAEDRRSRFPEAARTYSSGSEQAYQHELYHILQAARNPIYKKMVNFTCNSFLGAILSSLPLAVVALMVGTPTVAFLRPIELEAYRKTGGLTDFEGTLTGDPSFDSLRGKMFSFERV